MFKQLSIESPLGELLIEAKSNGEISLAMGELPRSIDNGMTIDKSIAFVITVKPILKITDIKFSANLVDSSLKGYSGTGECLDCIEFENDSWQLTIGTEDLEMLEKRIAGLSFPNDHNQIAYSSSGIALELNDVKMKGENTFHLVISYKKLPDDRGDSAWFFADIPHDLAIKAVTS